jgi:hypothetical protein
MGMGMIHWGRRWGQGEDGHEGDDLALGIRWSLGTKERDLQVGKNVFGGAKVGLGFNEQAKGSGEEASRCGWSGPIRFGYPRQG